MLWQPREQAGRNLRERRAGLEKHNVGADPAMKENRAGLASRRGWANELLLRTLFTRPLRRAAGRQLVRRALGRSGGRGCSAKSSTASPPSPGKETAPLGCAETRSFDGARESAGRGPSRAEQVDELSRRAPGRSERSSLRLRSAGLRAKRALDASEAVGMPFQALRRGPGAERCGTAVRASFP